MKQLELPFADTPNPLEKQVGGNHYKKYAIQPAEYCYVNNIPWLEGECIVKLTRWRDKGGIEDLMKVLHAVELLIYFEKKKMEEEAERVC